MAEETTETTETTESPNLDDLLKEFGVDDAPATVETKPVATPEPDAALAAQITTLTETVNGFIQKDSAREFDTEVSGVVGQMREEFPALKNLPESALRGYLDETARGDKRIQDAWTGRKSNPAAFKQVVSKLAEELASPLAQAPDQELTDGREAVRNYVRSQEQDLSPDDKIPPQAELAAMSDAEFDAVLKKATV